MLSVVWNGAAEGLFYFVVFRLLLQHLPQPQVPQSQVPALRHTRVFYQAVPCSEM